MNEFRTFGDILEKDFIIPHYLGYSNFSKVSGLPIQTIKRICKGEQDVNEKIALSLSHSFNNSTNFWLSLQKARNQEQLDRMSINIQKKR